jgi:phosphoribosyl 1,2-cyclic phosphodiesterase
MDIRFWGTRGSIPAPGPSTLRYGGNTSCVEIRLKDGTLVIVDAGSGIRPLGAALGTCDAVLLLSHYHWDHIQGMPFFIPAYSPKSSVRIMGPEYNGAGPYELLDGQMQAPYFPAPASAWLGITGSQIIQQGETFTIGSVVIRSARLSHPGPTFGYRFEEGGRAFVYASDNEPDVAPPEQISDIVKLAAGADILVHDCQYTEAEYETKHGWGHSTPRQAVRIAAEAGVRQLLLFHHDPAHTDEQVEALADEVRSLASGIDVVVAREGDTLVLRDQSTVSRPASASSN